MPLGPNHLADADAFLKTSLRVTSTPGVVSAFNVQRARRRPEHPPRRCRSTPTSCRPRRPEAARRMARKLGVAVEQFLARQAQVHVDLTGFARRCSVKLGCNVADSRS